MLVGLALVGAVGSARAQLSPGPLSNAHRDLDSPLRCNSCHVFGAGQPVFVCTKCHEEIGSRLAAGQGYHGRVVKPAEQERDCAACHREHVGRDFQLVHWPKGEAAFDHAETGFELTGKHGAVQCRTCHSLDYVDLDALRETKVQDPDRSFLGLPTDCAICHADPHRGQVGSDCRRCHVTEGFDDISKFDHQQTAFPLTGRHAAMECQGCHKEIDGFVPLNSFSSTSCRNCHQDPHAGAFQAACERCHSTSNWLPKSLSQNFDHGRTDFPLLGKHVGLSCAECHAGARFKDPVPHTQCLDCHQGDNPHGEQFAGRADGGECGICHTVDAFKPTTFTREMHQQTAYPLDGKHAAVDCDSCHEPLGRGTVYKISASDCRDCHEDAHNGDFAGEPHLNQCDTCHTVQGFRPSTFPLSKHRQSRFELTGVHLAVACIACHQRDASDGSPARLSFRADELDCPVCHEDPHAGQFTDKWAKSPTEKCGLCHDVSTWASPRQFDHSRTAFPLEDAHRAVLCRDCHRSQDGSPSVHGVVFKDAPQQCAGCHEDVHAGQFDLREPRQACSMCHTNKDWHPTQFDHRLYSAFPLDGAHQNVPCRLCHSKKQTLDAMEATLYRGTPRRCEACHQELP